MYPFESKSRFKHFVKPLFIIIPLSCLITALFWYFISPLMLRNATFFSPIPDFLQVKQNNQVHLLDFWSPVIQQIYGDAGDIHNLTAESVLMYDLTEKKILFQKEPKTRRPMASLTKIMTAIIALENKKSDNAYVVPVEALVGEDSMGLTAGEILTQEELLYGLLLPSGNDAAEVFAANFPTHRVGFIQTMNDKAHALGLVDTHFTNPSGLQGDGDQYTTTFDLLVMTRYALENFPIFKQIVATPEIEIAETKDHQGYTLTNETNLLTSYPGVKGVKTGYTPEAGLCLVTYLDYEGHQLIGILLNSQDRRGEMKTLLDYSLKTLGIEPPEYKE